MAKNVSKTKPKRKKAGLKPAALGLPESLKGLDFNCLDYAKRGDMRETLKVRRRDLAASFDCVQQELAFASHKIITLLRILIKYDNQELYNQLHEELERLIKNTSQVVDEVREIKRSIQ